MSSNIIVKNVLAVHWRGSNINSKSRVSRKKLFKDEGINLDLFQFTISDDPSYVQWEKTFKTIDFSKYDAIYTSSLWWVMTLRYMYENNLTINRIVLVVPWISFKTLNWEKPNLSKLHSELWSPDLSSIANSKFVISSKDDDIVPYQSWEKVANMLDANFILLDKWWHNLKAYLELIIDLVKSWRVENGF